MITKSQIKLKRGFDILLALILIPLVIFPLIFFLVIATIETKQSGLFKQKRVGQYGNVFNIYKIRTLKKGKHELGQLDRYAGSFGKFLRVYKLDELPQLFNVLFGDMSFVGPRPALFNQDDLISLRNRYGVDKILPGLTGWAQVNGRDELPIKEKVSKDVEYLKNYSFMFDLKIMWLTLSKVIKKDGVSH